VAPHLPWPLQICGRSPPTDVTHLLGVVFLAIFGSNSRVVLFMPFKSDIMEPILFKILFFWFFNASAAADNFLASACCAANFILAAFIAKSSSATTASALVSACLIKLTYVELWAISTLASTASVSTAVGKWQKAPAYPT
jgi:hypothetical protein